MARRRRLGRIAAHLLPASPPGSASASSGGEARRPPELSAAEQRAFVRDGWVIVRGAVSRGLTEAARREVNIENGRKGWRAAYAKLARHSAMTELITASSLGELLHHTNRWALSSPPPSASPR